MTDKISQKIKPMSAYEFDIASNVIKKTPQVSSVTLLQELSEIVNFLNENRIQFFIDKAYNVLPNIIKNDSHSAFYVSLNPQGNIIEVNNTALEMSGYLQDELLHQNFFDIFIDEADKKTLNKVFQNILEGNNNFWHYQNNIILKDASKLMLQWSNALVHELDSDTAFKCIHAFGLPLTK